MPTNSNPDILEEIRLGLERACARMPKEPDRRREEVEYLLRKDVEAKEAVAEAQKEAGVKDAEKRLSKVFGVAKITMQIMRKLHPMKPGDRAAVLGQVSRLSMDMGYTDLDLVSMAEVVTKGAGDDAQPAVFDNSRVGKAMGGEPRHEEPAAAAATPESAPTPGLSVEEYTRRFQEAHDAWKAKGGRGRKPKVLVEAEAALTAAEKARTEQEHAAQAEPAAAEDDDFEDDIPEPVSRSPLAGATGQGTYTVG